MKSFTARFARRLSRALGPGLLAIAFAALVPAVAGEAAGEPVVTIRVGAGVNDTVSNLFDAAQLGYFKQHNLDVQIQRMTSGAAEASALAGGSLDIAESNVVSMAAAHLRGLPFVYIAPGGVYDSTAPTSELACASASKIRTGKDLVGKNIGVIALGDLSQLAPYAWIGAAGGDPAGAHYIEMPASAIPPAIERGSVDAAILPEPTLSGAVAGGTVKICANAYLAIAPVFMLNGWITTDEWLKKNADAARRFREAMLDAAKWANRNHAASASIFAANSSVPLAVIQSMRRATFAERFDATLFQPVINAAAAYKFIGKAFPASEIVAGR